MCKKATAEYNLAIVHPAIAAQWHPTKNGNLKPTDVTPGSSQVVWWLCTVCTQAWDMRVGARTSTGACKCPYCVGKRVGPLNCLAAQFPEIAKEWHLTKNRPIKPTDITSGSTLNAWWTCPDCGQHFQQRVFLRTCKNSKSTPQGCPYCCGKKVCTANCLATKRPDLAKEWHPIRNGNLKPTEVTTRSSKIIFWECSNCDFIWRARISHRNRGTRCPQCSSKSKGEDRINEVLLQLKLPFEREFSVEGCRNVRPLRFDFALTGNQLKLIEYQGKQHYIVDGFGTVSELALIQLRDKIKKDFCEKNKIPFLAIPYWDREQLEKLVTDFVLGTGECNGRQRQEGHAPSGEG